MTKITKAKKGQQQQQQKMSTFPTFLTMLRFSLHFYAFSFPKHEKILKHFFLNNFFPFLFYTILLSKKEQKCRPSVAYWRKRSTDNEFFASKIFRFYFYYYYFCLSLPLQLLPTFQQNFKEQNRTKIVPVAEENTSWFKRKNNDPSILRYIDFIACFSG